MAFKLPAGVHETTSTAGTGTITLLGAVSGNRSFAQELSDGDTTFYCIRNSVPEIEVGLGTFTASGTTLSRTTVYGSTNGGALLTLSGTYDVIIGLPGELIASLLNPAAGNGGLERTGTGAYAAYTLTAAGKALLDDADAAAQLTTLGVPVGIQKQSWNASSTTATGHTVDALKYTYSPVPAALVDKMRLVAVATGANTVAGVTFNPDITLLTAKTVVKRSDEALVPGDIPGADYPCDLQYDSSLDKWVLLNPANPPIVSAETTVLAGAGIVTIAHGLTATIPSRVAVSLRCKTNDLGYVAASNDEAEPPTATVSVSRDGTNVYIVTSAAPSLIDRGAFTAAAITPASWRWVVRAWR